MTLSVHMLPGMSETLRAPLCKPLLVGQILIFQHAGNKNSKSQKVSDPKMPITTPMVLTHGGAGRGEDLMLSTCKFAKKTTHKGLKADMTPMNWNIRVRYISILMFYG